MSRYFLGMAATYRLRDVFRQLFTVGRQKDCDKLCAYLKERYEGEAILCKNGRSALAIALKSYFDPGDAVIVNGFTCQAVIQGVKAGGMKPVFADIDLGNLNFTVESIKKVLTEKTQAIIVQNTLGNMAPIQEIEKFAKRHKLIIIEDLAHCTGRKYDDGREAGMVGDITVFSFGKEKTIDVINGGAAAFRKSSAEVVKLPKLKPPFIEVLRARLYPTFGAMCRGLSYVRMDGFLMWLLLATRLVKKSADGEVDYDKRRLSYFQAKLALEQLRQREKIGKKPLREFYLVESRAEVLEKFKKAGYYFSGFWYETPVAPARYYKSANFPEQKCPNAVFASKHIVNLPNYYTKRELEKAKRILMCYVMEVEQ